MTARVSEVSAVAETGSDSRSKIHIAPKISWRSREYHGAPTSRFRNPKACHLGQMIPVCIGPPHLGLRYRSRASSPGERGSRCTVPSCARFAAAESLIPRTRARQLKRPAANAGALPNAFGARSGVWDAIRNRRANVSRGGADPLRSRERAPNRSSRRGESAAC
jgi:hypothetical protein